MSMVGIWDKHHHKMLHPLGCEETYRVAQRWLEGFGLVEDWGCGTCYARQFFKQYRGVDGSGVHAEIKADLTDYKSRVPCILLRHVLEHNMEWRSILRNALESFQYRMMLVLFMPPEDEQRDAWLMDNEIPHLHLPEKELNEMIAPFLVKRETVVGEICYHLERSA